MSRLIDADAFRRKLDEHYPFTKDEQSKHGMADIAKSAVLLVLNTMPTVEERKTGAWISCDSDAERYDDIRCSVCGKRFTVDAERWCDIGFIASDLKYCPNCGAKMEES